MKPAVSLRACILLALVVPAGLSIAHQYQQGDPIDQINPGPLGMAQFGRIVSGEFNGDFVRDVYVMDAHEPKLVVWPESHKNAHSIGAIVSDMDVFPGVASGKDGLLTVDSYGLRMWEYDVENDEFDQTVIADSESAWGGALLVRVAEVDGSNGKDIVGVAANGKDVLVMLNDGDNTFTAGTGYTNTYDIYDMVVLNWRETNDTAGTDEIATFTWNNYQVREPSGGQVLKTAPWTVSRIYGAKVKDAGVTTERLAMIAASSGSDWLATIGVGGTQDGPQSIGAAGVVSMTSGDADNDGDSEIFLSITSEKKFWMFENEGATAPTFDFGSPVKYGYGPPTRNPALNEAELAAADFDGDGFLDVLAQAQGHLTGMITAYGTLVHKQLGYGTADDLKVGVTGSTYNYLPHPDELTFGITAPETVMSVDTGNIAKLRVDVFQTDDLQGVTTPTALKSAVIPLPSDEWTELFTFKLPAGYDPTSGGSHETFSLVVRQVEVAENDETNTVLDEGPALCVMWVPQRHYSGLAAATDVVTPTTTFSIGVDDPPAGGGSGTGPTVPAPGDGSTPKR